MIGLCTDVIVRYRQDELEIEARLSELKAGG